MINFVVKRDFSKEPFQASKLNKWMRWAGESLKDRLNWSDIILDVVRKGPNTINSQQLQRNLIERLKEEGTRAGLSVAGKLLSVLIKKQFYGDNYPTVKKLHKKLYSLGKMLELDYNEEDYEEIEKIINHSRDMELHSDNIEHITKKYSIKDEETKVIYESPQFVYMRVAMHMAEDELKYGDRKQRIDRVKSLYLDYSFNRVNLPSPTNLFAGTPHKGLASCCLIMANDDIESLAVAHHASYRKTANSAGIGSFIACRSLGDPVRKKSILHQGKIPYLSAQGKIIKANIQSGRAGADNGYFSLYDPEYEKLISLQNPRTAENLRNRDMHFTFQINNFLLKKSILKEDVFLFNRFTAPDLWDSFFDSSSERFESIYNKYLNDDTFKKVFVKAQDLFVKAWSERYNVGTLYVFNSTAVNKHTSFLETIYQSNLCVEITQPTYGYGSMIDLYSEKDHGHIVFKTESKKVIKKPYNDECRANNLAFYYGGLSKHDTVEIDNEIEIVESIVERNVPGEISMCSLAAVVMNNCNTDEEYETATYNAIYTATRCVEVSNYPLPHVGFTAKKRLNVGIGVLGQAYVLAKAGLKFSSLEGKKLIHRLAERHSYFCIKSSLELGKKYGNAQWMHKTKWPRGWLPIDTGNKAIDKIVQEPLHYDWESLRNEIVKNKGIRNSAVISLMPTESSSKSSLTTPGIYPILNTVTMKSDQDNVIDWCAPENDSIGSNYELAFDIDLEDQFHNYAIWQKFMDQSISADIYKDRSKNPTINSNDLLKEAYLMGKLDIKTLYYSRVKTNTNDESETIVLEDIGEEFEGASCSIDGGCGC